MIREPKVEASRHRVSAVAWGLCLLGVVLLETLSPAATAGAVGASEKATRIGPSGLALPRFVSLASDKVNLRTGPGVRYPIAWVFVRRGLPVLITREYENWRKVRDSDGAEGWVHRSLLTGHRRAVVIGATRTLRRDPSAEAPAVLRAEAGVIGRLLACRAAWCRLEIADIEGWLERTHIHGALPDEDFE